MPNKVYQMLASGKPVITRRSLAIEELAADQDLNLILVEANDPEGLVDAIQGFAAQAGSEKPEQVKTEPARSLSRWIADKFGPLAVASQYSRMLEDFWPKAGNRRTEVSCLKAKISRQGYSTLPSAYSPTSRRSTGRGEREQIYTITTFAQALPRRPQVLG